MGTLITFLQRAVCQGIPLLYGATGEILTEKSGNLNLGIPGIMYIGSISGVIGAFLYEQSVDTINPVLALLIPLLSCLLGALLIGLVYCFLTVTLRANQNVTGLAITTFGVGFGNFFGGSLIKLTGSAVPSVALTATSAVFKKTLPFADSLGAFGKVFLSYGFLAYLAVIIAIVCAVFLKRTRAGLHLRAVGENPATADAAGINVEKTKYLALAKFFACSSVSLISTSADSLVLFFTSTLFLDEKSAKTVEEVFFFKLEKSLIKLL